MRYSRPSFLSPRGKTSTGVYGYPVEDAARIAVKTVTDYLAHHPEIELVRLVLFGRAAYEVYQKALQEL